MYKQQLLDSYPNAFLNRKIQSHNYELHTIKQIKKCLCSYDDKQYIIEDRISKLVHGHFSIPHDINFDDFEVIETA